MYEKVETIILPQVFIINLMMVEPIFMYNFTPSSAM